jgi:putative ABC transport system substrate-binding protein
MDRRAFLGVLVSGLLAGADSVEAQQTPRPYGIGYLGQGSKSDELGPAKDLPTLLKNLRVLGYVEGQNLTVDARFADGRPEDLSALAAQLVKASPRVIVVVNAGIARAVLEHTKIIPVVALHAGELEAEPNVKSLAKPGGNLTGMQLHSPELIGKRLQLLDEVVPNLRRVAVLRGVPFEGPGFLLYRDANDAAAAKLGIRPRYIQFEKPADLDRLFEEMARKRDQALLVWANPHLNAYRKQIFDLTLQYRVPALYDVRGHPEELLVYAAKLDDVQREAATYVDKILRGANPGDLAIGQAKTFELIVNLRTAKALGITVPQSLLLRADEVIQ